MVGETGRGVWVYELHAGVERVVEQSMLELLVFLVGNCGVAEETDAGAVRPVAVYTGPE